MIVKISALLRVSAAQLLDRGQAARSTGETVERRFLRRLKLVKGLPKRDQDALLRTMDAFLQRAK
ncbi:MAG: hypothetical protein U1E65_23280 [Myxococcota bacterium]